MTTIMNDSHIGNISQIKEFIKVARGITFKGGTKTETYKWIEDTLFRFRYFNLKKKEKTIIKTYLMKMTGYSRAQMTRLIAKNKESWKNSHRNNGETQVSKSLYYR